MQAGECHIHSAVLKSAYLRPMKSGKVRKLIRMLLALQQALLRMHPRATVPLRCMCGSLCALGLCQGAKHLWTTHAHLRPNNLFSISVECS